MSSDYVTRMDIQTTNSNPNLTCGDDWLAGALESDSFSSLEHNQGTVSVVLIVA